MNPNLRYIGNEANFLKNIGFRIQFFRKKSGLSQEELAEKSGLSYSTISHIESSTPYPMSMVAIYRIANALDVTIKDLFYYDNDVNKLKEEMYHRIEVFGLDSREVYEISQIIDLLLNVEGTFK